MVETILSIEPTKEEALYLLNASRLLAWQGKQVACPRCGKYLRYIEKGTSYTIACSDDECISLDFRGI